MIAKVNKRLNKHYWKNYKEAKKCMYVKYEREYERGRGMGMGREDRWWRVKRDSVRKLRVSGGEGRVGGGEWES